MTTINHVVCLRAEFLLRIVLSKKRVSLQNYNITVYKQVGISFYAFTLLMKFWFFEWEFPCD